MHDDVGAEAQLVLAGLEPDGPLALEDLGAYLAARAREEAAYTASSLAAEFPAELGHDAVDQGDMATQVAWGAQAILRDVEANPAWRGLVPAHALREIVLLEIYARTVDVRVPFDAAEKRLAELVLFDHLERSAARELGSRPWPSQRFAALFVAAKLKAHVALEEDLPHLDRSRLDELTETAVDIGLFAMRLMANTLRQGASWDDVPAACRELGRPVTIERRTAGALPPGCRGERRARAPRRRAAARRAAGIRSGTDPGDPDPEPEAAHRPPRAEAGR